MILKLNDDITIQTEHIAATKVEHYQHGSDVFCVYVGGGAMRFPIDSDETRIIRDWLTGNILDRLETCDDGELQNIQTDAHEAGILPEAIAKKAQERRNAEQARLDEWMDKEEARDRDERIKRRLRLARTGDRVATINGVPF